MENEIVELRKAKDELEALKSNGNAKATKITELKNKLADQQKLLEKFAYKLDEFLKDMMDEDEGKARRERGKRF
jgi:uncharacterized coiled-coil protein SlyX